MMAGASLIRPLSGEAIGPLRQAHEYLLISLSRDGRPVEKSKFVCHRKF
jgi:hypothetical protein